MKTTMISRLAGAAAITLLAATAPVGAQNVVPAPLRTDTVTVVPGPSYEANGLKRWLLGDNWRALWLTPVRAPVFDLGAFEGGMELENQGGGNQSITLHMVDADGDGWVFRSIDKYPAQALPPELNGAPAGRVLADHISALNPGGHFLMPRLLEAAGILHVVPNLYVMPDDPRLGEFRETFAGMLGEVEAKPNEGPDDTPGTWGSTKIKGTDEFLNDIEESWEFRLDAQEFLRARLIDMWVGDPDRGSDQWRFARYGEEGNYVYRPVPRDRDWVTVHADGVIARRFRSFYPKVMEFGASYPEIEALTTSSHIMDQRLLSELTWVDFEREAANVQRVMTDEVIDEAVNDMPPEFVAVAGERIASTLRARRARLPDVAREFYDWLAVAVDVRATDEDDRATVERRSDGTVRVRLSPRAAGPLAGSDGENGVYFDRIFQPDETEEVRVYLHGGDDHAVVTGSRSGPIVVRVIGGGSDDLLEDETGLARFYDDRGDNEFVRANGTSVDTKEWEAPDAPEGFRLGSAWAPDRGSESVPFAPVVGYDEASGVILGGGPRWKKYGFRHLPYEWSFGIDALYGTRSQNFGAAIHGDYHFENSPRSLLLDARASQFDSFRFYGYGNDTPEIDAAQALVTQDRVRLHTAMSWHIGMRPGTEEFNEAQEPEDVEETGGVQRPFNFTRAMGPQGTFAIGPVVQWSESEVPAGNPLSPAAGSAFRVGQVGALATFELGETDRDGVPRRGWRIFAEADAYPAVWDVGDEFGSIGGQVHGYVPLIGETHLAMRVGGEKVFGDAPPYEAAYIGGRHSLRGFRSQRYAGDAAAFGGIEVRVPVDTIQIFFNGELGVFGLADAGRVWFDGESEGEWHTSYGGGLWFSVFDRAVSAAYARGERDRYYVWMGLPF